MIATHKWEPFDGTTNPAIYGPDEAPCGECGESPDHPNHTGPVPDLTIHFPVDPESAAEAVAAFLATLPDEAITREYMRRHNARRAQAGGRTKLLRPCPKGCGHEFGARDLRRHLPTCTGKPKPTKKRAAKKSGRKKASR